jgi:hypothetical protein
VCRTTAALKLASVQQRLEGEVSELQAALARHPQMEGLRQQHETAMAQLLAKTATERADMERCGAGGASLMPVLVAHRAAAR